MPKKKVLNVFISQPMNGRSEEEILKERKWAMRVLGIANPYKKTWEIHVIDSYVKKDVPDFVGELRQPRLWYLGDSIKLMADADFVVMVKYYTDLTSGCLVERKVAYEYDIPFIDGPVIGGMTYLKKRMVEAMRLKNKLVYNK